MQQWHTPEMHFLEGLVFWLLERGISLQVGWMTNQEWTRKSMKWYFATEMSTKGACSLRVRLSWFNHLSSEDSLTAPPTPQGLWEEVVTCLYSAHLWLWSAPFQRFLDHLHWHTCGSRGVYTHTFLLTQGIFVYCWLFWFQEMEASKLKLNIRHLRS